MEWDVEEVSRRYELRKGPLLQCEDRPSAKRAPPAATAPVAVTYAVAPHVPSFLAVPALSE